jgi:hypothetical protein
VSLKTSDLPPPPPPPLVAFSCCSGSNYASAAPWQGRYKRNFPNRISVLLQVGNVSVQKTRWLDRDFCRFGGV